MIVLVGITLFNLEQAHASDILIADFENTNYDNWTISGNAFGDAPPAGTLQNQMKVSGFRGKKLVNTFKHGDQTTGTAISKPFEIKRKYIAFLIGGGADLKEVGIELLVDNQPVRAATGSESEHLLWASWNVESLIGRQARLRIYDHGVGGWGHINVDHIIQTNNAPRRFDRKNQLEAYRKSEQYLDEPWRPQVHFSPEINWMNDPNGLVYYEGEYHLFYQYNPAGNQWGHMSWGHAVSRDLVHWENLPLAIPEENGEMAFSGCCIVDHQNTSGLGSERSPPMIAVYTAHGHGKQVQNLAFSNDRGRTWAKFKDNPILDINEKNFRDPKVFWHQSTQRWVMVVSLALEKVLVFYGSEDLKKWKELSRFGPAGASDKSNWECPDLFELEVEGSTDEKHWVLEVDMGAGSIAGGSGGEYFVGKFNGQEFIATQDARWVDFGRDFYAPISWSNIPRSDGRRIWLGWFNNWETCLIPTSPWRSSMSFPRTLALRKIHNEKDRPAFRLIQRPVDEIRKLIVDEIPIDTSVASWPPTRVTQPDQLNGMHFILETTLVPGTAQSCGLRIQTGPDEFLEVGYDNKNQHIYVDRTESGEVNFHPSFAGRHKAPTQVINGEIKLTMIIDRSSIELFINDGESVISDRFFPRSANPVVKIFASNNTASLKDTRIQQLNSIWQPQEKN